MSGAEFMKIMTIINSRYSRCNKAEISESINNYFKNDDISIEETISYDQARSCAKRAVAEDYNSIIAVGGDGTVNAVVNEIYGTDIRLGIIQSGTANDLANYHKISSDVNKALRLIKEGSIKKIDLIQVNNICYASSGGIGFPLEVAVLKNRLLSGKSIFKPFLRSLGSLIYIIVFFLCLFKKLIKDNVVNIISNGNSIEKDYFSVMINNQEFLGNYFRIAPGAENNDSLADIVLIRSMDRRTQIITLLKNVIKGSHSRMVNVFMWKSDKLILKTNKIVEYFGDGEVLCKSNYFEIKVLPLALNIFVPSLEDNLSLKREYENQQLEMS